MFRTPLGGRHRLLRPRLGRRRAGYRLRHRGRFRPGLRDAHDLLEVALCVQARVLVLERADPLLELFAAGVTEPTDAEHDQNDGERAGREGDDRDHRRREGLGRPDDRQRFVGGRLVFADDEHS